jgi:hypothetical protein
MVPRDEGALCRLLRAADYFIGKKSGEGRSEFSLRIRLAVRRHEEPRIILHAGESAEPVSVVMKQNMPFPFVGETGRCGLFNQFGEIRDVRLS